MKDSSGKTRPLLAFISSNGLAALDTWDVCIPQGKSDAIDALQVKTSSGDVVKVRPRGRQFERTRSKIGFLRINKQRVGEISDEQVGLADGVRRKAEADWAEERRQNQKLGATVPGYFYRRYRDRPLLTIHVIEPVEPAEDKVEDMLRREEIEPKLLVAVSLSFPMFDGAGASVVYALNKVALREAGLLDDDEAGDEDQD